MVMEKKFICTGCAHEWQLSAFAENQEIECPICRRGKVYRIDGGARQRSARSWSSPAHLEAEQL